MIETPEEHERLLTIAEALMDKGDALSAEERKLLELLVLLIEVFEAEVEEQDAEEDGADEREEHTTARPSETITRLLQARGWQPDALNDIFGNPKLVSDALGGRKSITRGQAKALGKLFQAPFKLFLGE